MIAVLVNIIVTFLGIKEATSISRFKAHFTLKVIFDHLSWSNDLQFDCVNEVNACTCNYT